MRAVVLGFAVMCPLISGVAADIKSESSQAPDCPRATHSHQHTDLRMAMIEVSDVSQCSFRYANLEANTVGLDNSFEFSHDFVFVKVTSKDKASTVVKTNETRAAMRKGLRGVAVYCSICKTVFTFRPYSERNGPVVVGEQ